MVRPVLLDGARMKQVPMVIGVVVAAVAGSGIQSSSMIARLEFEPALLFVWGVALLVVGQRIKARSRQEVRALSRPGLTPTHVQARAHAA